MKKDLRKIPLLFLVISMVMAFGGSGSKCEQTDSKPQTQKSNESADKTSGQEDGIYVIEGKKYEIESARPMFWFDDDGNVESVFYDITWVCNKKLDFDSLTEESALDIAFPLIDFAYDKIIEDDFKLAINGVEHEITDIAVIMKKYKTKSGKKPSTGVFSAEQYRVHISVDEIIERRKQQQ
jgi:hypothetical protein